MTTTSESPRTRWPRFLPKQFSIGALLILITVAALATWWCVQLPMRTISNAQAAKIDNTMFRPEVQSILGKPSATYGRMWEYLIDDGDSNDRYEEWLIIKFREDDRVKEVSRASVFLLRPR